MNLARTLYRSGQIISSHQSTHLGFSSPFNRAARIVTNLSHRHFHFRNQRFKIRIRNCHLCNKFLPLTRALSGDSYKEVPLGGWEAIDGEDFEDEISADEPSDFPQLKELDPLPEYILHRESLWKSFKEAHVSHVAAKEKHPIKIRVSRGEEETEVDGVAWETTPFSLAKKVYPKASLAKLVLCDVDGKKWDINRPIESNCSLKYFDFESDEGKFVYWNSSALILAGALERLYGGTIGQVNTSKSSFFCDMKMTEPKDLSSIETEDLERQTVKKIHYGAIENTVKKVIKAKEPFERLVLNRDQLLELFSHNEFRCKEIREKPKDFTAPVYRCGTFIDISNGPHIRHAGCVKIFKIHKVGSGMETETSKFLQRIFGISFPDSKNLEKWEEMQESYANSDHRRIGKRQDLFLFHAVSPGSCFFTPRGAMIYNTLIDFIKKEYWKRGYEEVITPNVFKSKLWERSGHWEHFSENMFTFQCDDDAYALKPMNCPAHCLLFSSKYRSSKELPIRYADFGVLHRNELSGALSGLTRVRRFQQDDAHIFCRKDQIKEEIKSALEFTESVYSTFGLTFSLCLSTRPPSYMGELKDWEQAEEDMKGALDAFCESSDLKWELNPGDGAFYGPKIDITVNDASGRPRQCATIQLDFQLPLRFGLSYLCKDRVKERPVIIHRAIYGSIERFIAILSEHYRGKWPFWLSPRQAMVLTTSSTLDPYAATVQKELREHGFKADFRPNPGLPLPDQVRKAQLDHYNFMLIIGPREMQNNTVNVRTRDMKQHGERTLNEVVSKFKHFVTEKTLNAEEAFETDS